MAAPDVVVDLAEKAALLEGHWLPRVVAAMNDVDVKIVKVQGTFDRHHHDDTDELFLVLAGTLRIEVDGRDDAVLGPGQLYVVPRGVDHRPVAEQEVTLLLLEPAGTVNTGDVAQTSALTAPPDHWL